MADDGKKDIARELIRDIIDDRPDQIAYFNSLSRDQLLESLDLEIQIVNNMISEAKNTEKSTDKKTK